MLHIVKIKLFLRTSFIYKIPKIKEKLDGMENKYKVVKSEKAKIDKKYLEIKEKLKEEKKEVMSTKH